MTALHRLESLLNKLVDKLSLAAALLIFPMMLVMLYEVVGRYVYGRPTIWAHELCGLLYSVYFLVGGVYALRRRAHINVDVIHGRLSPRARACVDLVSWNLFYFFAAVLLWYGAEYAWSSVLRLEHSMSVWGPPVWPIKLMIPLTALLLLLLGFMKTAQDFHRVFLGEQPSDPNNSHTASSEN